ncbi:DUF6461 domain-containing protein [Nonomuraea zeae]|uniref:Uncharacterized protein n=1 Tax=Nonomuraea zeae TaxID=1642303 RepID=A0A5S4H4V1_9ACTN|nr:DUF6461 domain-containing protein [Nonomuraea zeae]TMR33880.1 hypothetical protein ETD85_18550 [Nonomuraea zeae]
MVVSGPTATAYEWLYREWADDTGDLWLCVCFVRDVTPGEALRRIGVTPGPATDGFGFGVAAYPARGGTFLVEDGWGHVVYHQARTLSAGTRAAALFVTSDDSAFAYFADGRSITAFNLYDCRARTGTEPDRLLPDLRELEMETSYEDHGWTGAPVTAALALAERATGVHMSRSRYEGTALFGSTGHLDPYA